MYYYLTWTSMSRLGYFWCLQSTFCPKFSPLTLNFFHGIGCSIPNQRPNKNFEANRRLQNSALERNCHCLSHRALLNPLLEQGRAQVFFSEAARKIFWREGNGIW